MIRIAAALLFLTGAFPTITLADLTVKGTNYQSPITEDGADFSKRRDTRDYTVYYKGNQMRMDTADNRSMISRPCGAATSGCSAGMEYLFIDHNRKEVQYIQSGAASIAEAVTSANMSDGSAQFVGGPDAGTLLGQQVRMAKFSVRGLGMPPDPKIPEQYRNMMKVKLDIDGYAWVAPDMKGKAELAGFYQNMLAEMAEREGMMGMNSPWQTLLSRGMTMVMTTVAKGGFPLRVWQHAEVKLDLQGFPPQMRSMMESMMKNLPGMKGSDQGQANVMEVSEVGYETVDAALFYGGGYPAGYKKKNLTSALAN